MKKIPKVASTTITPLLARVWKEVWCGSPLFYPKTIETYIVYFALISKGLRISVSAMLESFRKPIFSTEFLLEDLERDLAWLLKATNDINQESSRYQIHRRYRRLLSRIQVKNEKSWQKIDEKLTNVQLGNDDLFWEEYTDVLAEEIPYRKDFSVILKNFQKNKFQLN